MAVLTVADDAAALVDVTARRFDALVAEAVRERGSAFVSLTGGSTPRRLYECLANEPWRTAMPWNRLHLYWGDERCVPPEHEDSNYGMAHTALLSRVAVRPEQVHRMAGELPPDEAARDYERVLPGMFDLMLLGLGDDAHIASIFPGSPTVRERERLVAAPYVRHLGAHRITLTPPALLNARRIVMLVSGAQKATAVAAAIEEFDDPDRWPVHLLRGAADRVEWLIDRAAARALSSPHG